MLVNEITFKRVLTRDGETTMASGRNLRLFLLLITVLLTPGLIRAQEGSLEQAKKEGKVVWYTAMALEIAEQVANVFEKTYGIKVELTRSASERIVARVLQEAQAGINNVDIIEISEAGDFTLLKQKGLLRAYRPKNYERFPSNFLLDKEDISMPGEPRSPSPFTIPGLFLRAPFPSHGKISSTLHGKINSLRSTTFRAPGPTSWLP